MKESLDMSSDIADEVNIPEGFTVEADVTDCEMNSTFTVALTDIFKDIDLNDVDGLDELKDSMKDLTDAAVKLVDRGTDFKQWCFLLYSRGRHTFRWNQTIYSRSRYTGQQDG